MEALRTVSGVLQKKLGIGVDRTDWLNELLDVYLIVDEQAVLVKMVVRAMVLIHSASEVP